MNTSLVVEKDGKVISYLVNTFDKEFYSLDGLEEMVKNEAKSSMPHIRIHRKKR